MYRIGHYGMALVVYAPLAFFLVSVGFDRLAVLGGAVVVGGSMVPDWDLRIPFLSHRGITHTVWFALLVGILFGVGGGMIGRDLGMWTQVGLATFAFVVGAVMIGSHLIADALTPMGIRPLAPLRDDTVTFGLTTAGNSFGNRLLFVFGLLATAGAFVVGTELSDLIL